MNKEFEEWVSNEPYEMSIAKYNYLYQYPCTYKSKHVQFAWEAWQKQQYEIDKLIRTVQHLEEQVMRLQINRVNDESLQNNCGTDGNANISLFNIF